MCKIIFTNIMSCQKSCYKNGAECKGHQRALSPSTVYPSMSDSLLMGVSKFYQQRRQEIEVHFPQHTMPSLPFSGQWLEAVEILSEKKTSDQICDDGAKNNIFQQNLHTFTNTMTSQEYTFTNINTCTHVHTHTPCFLCESQSGKF